MVEVLKNDKKPKNTYCYAVLDNIPYLPLQDLKTLKNSN